MARRPSSRSLLLGALCAFGLIGAASPAPSIDFANFGPYPPPPCTVDSEHPPAFTLVKGDASWSTKAGDAGLDYQLRSVSFGHLRGDGSTQAAVLIGCDFPNAMFSQWVDVFDVNGAAATFVGTVPAGGDYDPTRSVRITGHRLIVVMGEKKIYALRAGRLVPVAR